MSDGGRDVTSPGGVIYQVKWTKNPIKDPVAWLKRAIEGEAQSITRLVEESSATKYVLMTSVEGTGSPDRGTMDRLDRLLEEKSALFGVEMTCLWRADIDTRVANAPLETWFHYSEMLAGLDAMRLLLAQDRGDGDTADVRNTIRTVIAVQRQEDSKVKFSQVDLEKFDLADLFVDLEGVRVASRRIYGSTGIRIPHMAEHLLGLSSPNLILIKGEPGQGKSTLAQYVCQMNRDRVLARDAGEGHNQTESHRGFLRVPFRADLRDYAAWLNGLDPWTEDEGTAQAPKGTHRNVETFIVGACRYYSGGRTLTVSQFQDFATQHPMLVVFDGLDEVADVSLRKEVVAQIERFAARMEASPRGDVKIIVTTRPNDGGLAEPSEERFVLYEISDLSEDLQKEYSKKWATVHGIERRRRRELLKVFEARRSQEHVAQLTHNPMQLAILLYLVNRRGESVSSSRTPLYDQFVEALLDREVEKSQVVKDNVQRIAELTSYLAWHLHSLVEATGAAGNLPTKQILRTLLVYLHETGAPTGLVQDLFRAISDRFWALSSRVEGTFEFSVQSLREYFAARYLVEFAGVTSGTPVLKSEVISAMVDRAFWANTARFYAGATKPNELRELEAGLRDAIERGRHPLQARAAVVALLSDGVFSRVPKAQESVSRLLSDSLSRRLLQASTSGISPLAGPVGSAGGLDLGQALLDQWEREPSRFATTESARVLPGLGWTRERFSDWWGPRVREHMGGLNEALWLELGASYPHARIDDGVASRADLSAITTRRALITLGAKPESGSQAEQVLVSAALAGEFPDTPSAGASFPGHLARVLRPQHFIDLAKGPGEPTFNVPVTHLYTTSSAKQDRHVSFRYLETTDHPHRILQQASSFRRGQSGSTAPWQHAARAIASLHRQCLPAAEIAVIGAANQGVTVGGDVDPNGKPFGVGADYGLLISESRAHRSDAQWWRAQRDECSGDVEAATWVMALFGVATSGALGALLPVVDEVLSGMDHALVSNAAQAVSRLGASGVGRRLPPALLAESELLQPITLLFVAHHCASLNDLDPLPYLSVQQLGGMAGFGAASWPVVRAVSARLLGRKEDAVPLLRVLRACGPDTIVPLPDSNLMGSLGEVSSEILGQPDQYPCDWVIFAEKVRSRNHEEEPLASVAAARGWVPLLD
jgi:hypothetical protein